MSRFKKRQRSFLTPQLCRSANRRLVLESLESRQLLAADQITVYESEPTPGISERALAAFHGEDLAGKDGPLSSLGLDLAGLYYEYGDYVSTGILDAFEPHNELIQVSDGNVLVDLVASVDTVEVVPQLEAAGMAVTGIWDSYISGYLPIASLPKIGGMSGVGSAGAAMAVRNVGLTTTQGDEAQQSDVARVNFGVNGSGITVGTLSDSYDALGGAATDIASFDLPAGVVVLQDDIVDETDEGRAMMQLIHDVAPGAALQFHTANGGVANFAQGIVDLANAGSDVIVDDVIYLAEPMFQDGPIAQAVDLVVTNGVSYFSAAGNSGRQSYESPFQLSGQVWADGSPLHDFDPGAGVDVFQQVTIGAGETIQISFQWDQPYFGSLGPGSASDIDIYLLDAPIASLDNVLAAGIDSNVLENPVEVFEYENESSSPLTAYVAITNFLGPSPGLMKYVVFASSISALSIDEYDTDSPTSFGHANAVGAESVGAAFYANTPEFGVSPPILEDFSSYGGVPILFDTAGNPQTAEVRDKPDIVAPDGGNTTFFGAMDVDFDGFLNFFGTSAAAPHAAAVAALMLEAAGGAGSLLPAQLYSLLETRAIDMDDPATAGFDVGFDFASGFGLIDANASVQAAQNYGSGGLVYRTGIDPIPQSFEVYDVATDTWTLLGAVETANQLAVSASGQLFMLDGPTNMIQRYDPDTNTWINVMSGPPALITFGNLEITNNGEFLITQSPRDDNFNVVDATKLWHTIGGGWSSVTLPGEASTIGDYEHATGIYVVAEHLQERIWQIDLPSFAITTYDVGATSTSLTRRFGEIFDQSWYTQTGSGPIRTVELSSPANPFENASTASPGLFASSAVNEATGTFYVNPFNGTQFQRWDPITDTFVMLAPAPTQSNHNALAFVGAVANVEHRVNEVTSGFQKTYAETRAVASNASGDYVVAFSGSGAGDSQGIFARRFDSTDTPQGPQFLVNETTGGNQRYASSAIGAGGELVVAWSGRGAGDNDGGVFVRLIDDSGALVGGEIRVNETIPSFQHRPNVAKAADGSFIVTWSGKGVGDFDSGVFARRFAADGTPLSGEFRVNTTTSGYQQEPDLAVGIDGRFVITWSGNGADDPAGIFFQRYDANGFALGTETPVNTTTNGYQSLPSVGIDGGDNFVITWSGVGAGDLRGVFLQRFDASGNPIGGEELVNTTTLHDQEDASVLVAPSGSFVVTWTSLYQDGGGRGVFGQEYDVLGARLGGEFAVNTTSQQDQVFSSVATKGEAGFVVAWSGRGTGDNSGVFARSFNRPGAVSPIAPLSAGLPGTTAAIDQLFGDDDEWMEPLESLLF